MGGKRTRAARLALLFLAGTSLPSCDSSETAQSSVPDHDTATDSSVPDHDAATDSAGDARSDGPGGTGTVDSSADTGADSPTTDASVEAGGDARIVDASPEAGDSGAPKDSGTTCSDASTNCSSSDVAGDYLVSTQNGSNACGFPNWVLNQVSIGSALSITQAGSVVTVRIGGAAGASLGIVVGSSTFQGTASRNHVDAHIIGTRSSSQAACVYTIDLTLELDVTGDSIQGILSYTPKTNGSPDCSALNGCSNTQTVSGSRAVADH